MNFPEIVKQGKTFVLRCVEGLGGRKESKCKSMDVASKQAGIRDGRECNMRVSEQGQRQRRFQESEDRSQL